MFLICGGKNERITIHIALVEELRKRGYELRNIIIWDRTNIVNKIGIFGWPSNYITMGVTFEYLLDFWKPANNAALKRKITESGAKAHQRADLELRIQPYSDWHRTLDKHLLMI